MTDIYIPKLHNENHGLYTISQKSCRFNIKNWRQCAANAEGEGNHLQLLYCQAKAQKIAGWLEDLVEEEGYQHGD